jgi:hypothetical protein
LQIIGESASTALGGAAATRERALDASISDYKIIHFATHGLINEERPELSGIVMSQFDETGQNLKGVVRLQDIYEMNLSADTVVLSACNTGIGKEVKGEGLLSLNNAFLQAGAKTVVSSLWKVDDYAAQELMKKPHFRKTSWTKILCFSNFPSARKKAICGSSVKQKFIHMFCRRARKSNHTSKNCANCLRPAKSNKANSSKVIRRVLAKLKIFTNLNPNN